LILTKKKKVWLKAETLDPEEMLFKKQKRERIYITDM